MTDSATPSARRLLARFGYLLSAQGVEALCGTSIFLYLAWLDSTTYGTIMYALAAGSMVFMVVQYGLYYPLVRKIGEGGPKRDRTAHLLNQVNRIKLALMLPSLAVVVGLALYRDFSSQTTWIVFLICLGMSMEALAETFFADFRVQGRQFREGRIKIASSVVAYGFAFVAATLGLSPILVGAFKLISGLVRLGFSLKEYLGALIKDWSERPGWREVWPMFRTATTFALIDILGTFYNKTNIFFLEGVAGVKGVAYYSAAWNIIDPISVLISQHFLAAVLFPVLAVFWISDRDQALDLARANALWLLTAAFPIMLFLYYESDFIIGLVYPDEYSDAVWLMKYLIWTIFLSFENNLFAYLMMVAGAARVLLIFAVVGTLINLGLNYFLISPLGLQGACLVIILTKLVMGIQVFGFCQINYRLFHLKDIVFPAFLIVLCLISHLALKPYLGFRPAGIFSACVYFLAAYKWGPKYMGRPRSGLATPL